MKKTVLLVAVIISLAFTTSSADSYENKRVAVENSIYNECINGGFDRNTCVCVVRKSALGTGDRLNSIYTGSMSRPAYQMILTGAFKQCGQSVTFNKW